MYTLWLHYYKVIMVMTMCLMGCVGMSLVANQNDDEIADTPQIRVRVANF